MRWIPESGVRGIRNLGNFCLWNPESFTSEFGIQLKESGIPLTIGIRNPSSTDKVRNPESGIHGVKSTIQDYLLDSLTLDELSLHLLQR